MKLYISGPIAGRVNRNLPEFERYAKALQKLGHETLIPDEIAAYPTALPKMPRWQENLRADLIEMLQCEGVVFLNDWVESPGSRFEHFVAISCGMPGFYLMLGGSWTSLKPAY